MRQTDNDPITLSQQIAELEDQLEDYKDTVRALEQQNEELKIQVRDAKHVFDHLSYMCADMLRNLS